VRVGLVQLIIARVDSREYYIYLSCQSQTEVVYNIFA